MSLRAALRARRSMPRSARNRGGSGVCEPKMRLPGSLSAVPGVLQRKPVVGPANDAYEREADQVAGTVAKGSAARAVTPMTAASVQRQGGGSGGNTRGNTGGGPSGAATAAKAVSAGGRMLSVAEAGFFVPRFRRDLSHVRVHEGPQVDQAAAMIGARAYTLGNDIALAKGEYIPGTTEGRRLMAHELTHSLQQTAGEQTIRRAPDGERKATDFKKVTMVFNGEELIVYGDGEEIMRYDGDSGRPIKITEEDAKACGADVDVDTYLNDKRFTGIKDKGPIPEGTYSFSPPGISQFSTGEQLDLLVGGIVGKKNVTVQGQSIHAGDWGAGRVHLNPVAVREGPCGNAGRRSAFFLHGGLLRGSSGCIDIQTSFDELAAFLDGYKNPVTLKVEYTDPATRVGFWTGLGGALAYQGFHFTSQATGLLGAEVAGDRTSFVASLQYNVLLDWAGGALTAGVHVDVPVDDRDAFIRAGLRGGAEYRVYRSLYGRIFGGGYYDTARGDLPAGFGLQAGGGLGYDFGPVQMEVLYNFLAPLGDEDAATSGRPERQRAHQVLTGIGFEW